MIAEGGRDCGAGFQEINIDTSLPSMPGSNDLPNFAIFLAGPSDLPVFEIANTFWAVFTEKGCKVFIA